MTESRLPTAADHSAGDRPLTAPTSAQRRQVLVLGGLILTTTVATTLAAFANPGADEWLYAAIRGWTWLDAMSWLEVAGTPLFLAGLGALVSSGGAAGRFSPSPPVRWRPATVGWILATVVGRTRPVESPVAGADSYPSSRSCCSQCSPDWCRWPWSL